MELTEFNINYLLLTPDQIKNMRAVSVPDVHEASSNQFHPDGLFSTQTFGTVGLEMRARMFAYMDLNTTILMPHYYKSFKETQGFLAEVMAGRRYAVWDTNTHRFSPSTVGEGETGYQFVFKHLDTLVFTSSESQKSVERVKELNGYRAKRNFRHLLIIPAGYRDYIIDEDTGKPEEGEVNALYRKILSYAKMLPATVSESQLDSLDNVRFRLQEAVHELYQYFFDLINGKHKLTQGKFAHRTVMHGTANVITSLINDATELHGDLTITTKEMAVGLYQYSKATTPKTIFDMKVGFLDRVFSTAGTPANLVDKKTLKGVSVSVSLSQFERWTTNEGLERVLNDYGVEALRHQPLVVDDYYLGLIYRDGESFFLLNGIDLLPEGFDKTKVSPLTFVEFLYACVFKTASDQPATATRYPVAAEGGIHPVMTALVSTVISEPLKELDQFGQPTGAIAKRFPINGEEFFNASSPPSKHIQRQNADFDGDRNDYLAALTLDAQDELRAGMERVSYYVQPTGVLTYAPGDDIYNLVLAHMTGDPEDE